MSQLTHRLTLAIALATCWLAFAKTATAQADLTLALEQASESPARYSTYTVTATLTNDGPRAATGVSVSVPAPAGVVYEGGNEFTASQGTFRPYDGQTWRVSRLASGASATLTVRYFLLDPSASPAFAQVSAADQADPDSTPGNGAAPTPREDDEASTTLGTGGGDDDDDDDGGNGGNGDVCSFDVSFDVSFDGATGVAVGRQEGDTYVFGVPFADEEIRLSDDGRALTTVAVAPEVEPFTAQAFDSTAGRFVRIRTFGPGGEPEDVFLGDISAAVPATVVLFVEDAAFANDQYVVLGAFRDAEDPSNLRPFTARFSAEGDLLSAGAFLGLDDGRDFNLGLSITAVLPDGRVLVSGFTGSRSFNLLAVAADDSGATLVARLGDLVTSTVNAIVFDEPTDRLYLGLRDQLDPSVLVFEASTLTKLNEFVVGEAAGLPADEFAPYFGDVFGVLPLRDGGAVVSYGVRDIDDEEAVGILRIGADGTVTENVDLSSLYATFPGRNNDGLAPVLESDDGEIVLASRRGASSERQRFVQLLPDLTFGPSCTGGGGTDGDGIDLSLTVEARNGRPGIYLVNEVTYTLTNDGPEDATDVTVEARIPDDVVYVGGDEATASRGTFAPYGADAGTWTLEQLPAGASATLTIRYFALASGGYEIFGQVTAADGDDADSTPGNNAAGASANEDDEAYLDLRTPAQGLAAYPNPSDGASAVTLQIERAETTPLAFDPAAEQSVEVILSDFNGRVVRRARVRLDGRANATVELSGLRPGVYSIAAPAAGLMPEVLVVR